MLNQAAVATLRILLFRAGPQDFPYSAQLTRLVVLLAMVAVFLQYRLTLPDAQAAVQAIASIAVLAAFTQALLRLRALANRSQQTINALLATGSALTLLLLPALSALAPQMMRLAQNPDLARTEPLPALPAMTVITLSLWNFLVSANIYRHALGLSPLAGGATAMICALLTVTLASAVAALVAG